MKKGLVLEGGAMRGMFTAGVIDVMMENNIEFDGAVGVSAGAAFGCNYKSRQIGRVLRYNTRFCNDKRYCGIRSLLTTGNIFNTQFCYEEVPMKYDVFDFETYRSNPMEFYVVCTDIESGKAIYKRCDDFDHRGFDWIRASSSMPLVAQIVEIEGQKLLDGGIADSIPVRFFEDIGYNRNIAVLTQPKGYQKKKNETLALIKWKYRKYPNLVEAVANRHLMYNEMLEYIAAQEQNGRLLVIRPDEALPIGRVEKDPEKLRAVYEIGRRAAEKQLENIRRYLDTDAGTGSAKTKL
ncbi:MAG: patatin family protein [Clostridia bacterium]|nr:patatin family protein [Clostridia bacterium]